MSTLTPLQAHVGALCQFLGVTHEGLVSAPGLVWIQKIRGIDQASIGRQHQSEHGAVQDFK